MSDSVVSPFAGTMPPRERNWFEKLLGLSRPELAEQALRALFAAESPIDVGESRIADILHRYRAYGVRARSVARRVWSRAFEKFLADNTLSDDELKYLDRISRLLDVGDDDIETIKAALIHPRYQKAVSAVVADGFVTKEERQFLETLQSGLRLPSELAVKLAENPTQRAAMARISQMVSDSRLSQDELDSIARLGADLNTGAEIYLDEASKGKLARFHELWRIENGDIPEVSAPINLQKSEICHFMAHCAWWEMRTRTTRIDYSGPVASIRIAKGLRYRIGSIAPQRATTEELTLIDKGTVFFTSKRIIFDGAKRNTAIRLSTLIGIQAYSNALVLQKATGRSPYLFIQNADLERAGVILSTLMATA